MKHPLVLSLALVLSCNGGSPNAQYERSPLGAVENRESWSMDGLNRPAMVVYTPGGVPYIYASDRQDLARVMGFTIARDRFFQIDLVRRLSTGTVSALLGDLALESDMESRGISMTHATDSLLASFTPEQRLIYTAYADGFNDYIAAVRAGSLPPPSEYTLAAPLLGAAAPVDLMAEFALRDVAAIGGTILFRLGYETGDIGNAADWQRLQAGLYDANTHQADLRQAAAEELWDTVEPLFKVASADGWGAQGDVPAERSGARSRPAPRALPTVNRQALDRLRTRMDRLQDRLGRDHENGWGSNAWAVAGDRTADGRALLAGDGHLELDIPALMYQIGLDTQHFGSGAQSQAGLSQVGLSLVGMPFLSVGTNGDVAWCTTQHSGDITDWFAEQIQLDANGVPTHSYFQGAWRELVAITETFEVANVPLLGSTGRTETWVRYQTFDGRWIASFEGANGSPNNPPEAGSGQTLVNVAGDWVIPGDTDGDGIVSALSFDFTGLDGGNLFLQFEEMGTASNISEFHEATRKASALSQNIIAADKFGDVLYTGYEMVPCRDHLRASGTTGPWAPGKDPTMIIDGTLVGGFTIPINDKFVAIEGDPDPTRCVVPFVDYPHQFTPERGYVSSANNDPAGIMFDNDMLNDPYWIGGPWTTGFRAQRVDELLAEAVADNQATIADMARIQGDHKSVVGDLLVPYLLDAIDIGRTISSQDFNPPEGSFDFRMKALYDAHADAFDDVTARLIAWESAGYPARSGVETFYAPVEPGDLDHAVATTIFNTWLGDVIRDTFDDENLPGNSWKGSGAAARLRTFKQILDGRGPGNPKQSAGWDSDTEEHVFFDKRATPDVERSDEVMLGALATSLAFLRSPPTAPATGGFGSDDPADWLWGLRHQVRFDSLVSSYVNDPLLAPLLAGFAITTDRLPLAESVPNGDPRRDVRWFPRHGDNRNVDAANAGLSGRSFTYGSGPVMRMVFSLGPDGVSGVNVIPGGQSGLIDSPHFSDQAELWLGNQTLDVPTTPEDVAAVAEWRATFTPKR